MPRDLLFEKASPVAASPALLFDWHARPGAFARLAPPWQRIEVVGRFPEIVDGSRVTLRMAKGPLKLRWVAEHRRVEPGVGFRDVQVSGPFALWEHDHLFEPRAGGGSTLRDRIRFRPPAGALGRLLMERGLRHDLERTFHYRHATTAADLELHAATPDRPALRVGVAGAGSLVGRTLTALLTTGGHEVVRLERRAAGGEGSAAGVAGWDPVGGVHRPETLELDAIFLLDGSSAAAPMLESLERLARAPALLAAVTGPDVAADRRASLEELVSRAAARLGSRPVLARLGAVLSPAGGPLARLLPVFRLGLGGRPGQGRRAVAWISVDDAAAALVHLLLSDGVEGQIELLAPEVVSSGELADTLGRVLGRPAALSPPAVVARWLYGGYVTEPPPPGDPDGARRLETGGFRFRHRRLEPALAHLLGRAVAD